MGHRLKSLIAFGFIGFTAACSNSQSPEEVSSVSFQGVQDKAYAPSQVINAPNGVVIDTIANGLQFNEVALVSDTIHVNLETESKNWKIEVSEDIFVPVQISTHNSTTTTVGRFMESVDGFMCRFEIKQPEMYCNVADIQAWSDEDIGLPADQRKYNVNAKENEADFEKLKTQTFPSEFFKKNASYELGRKHSIKKCELAGKSMAMHTKGATIPKGTIHSGFVKKSSHTINKMVIKAQADSANGTEDKGVNWAISQKDGYANIDKKKYYDVISKNLSEGKGRITLQMHADNFMVYCGKQTAKAKGITGILKSPLYSVQEMMTGFLGNNSNRQGFRLSKTSGTIQNDSVDQNITKPVEQSKIQTTSNTENTQSSFKPESVSSTVNQKECSDAYQSQCGSSNKGFGHCEWDRQDEVCQEK